MAYPWATVNSQETFNEYVAPYAFTNEPRTDWRALMKPPLELLMTNYTGDNTPFDVALYVNANLWSSSTSGLPSSITFKSSQTPLIYDPMSTLAFGYASCTGVSIVFASALRTLGIPARIAGTPAWNGVMENGNHNWIEVYDATNDEWAFIEAAPSGGGESFSNPCDKWFCSPSKATNTSFYATKWTFDDAGTVYPMAWDISNLEIPGIDRTSYMQEVCSKC